MPLKTYTFDTCALIAVIFKTKGHEKLRKILDEVENNEAQIIMHKTNLVEAFKVIARNRDIADAKMAYEHAIESPIIFHDTNDLPFCTEFAKVTNQFDTYFADTFVITTNILLTSNKGTIVTSDKGFDKVSKHAKVEYFK
ncbi:MAG: PIN domain-containing protein [Holophagaceae bacterium]|nr:PIN domain-containing protein [Holophagaceae bacterium]